MTSFIGGGGVDEEPGEFPAEVPEPASQDDLARLKASIMAFITQELAVRDEEIVELQRRVAALDGGPVA
jgi:hypothetical protein